MKITIMALHLGFGGIEKYVITIANMLSEKHDVEIISTYKMNEKPSFTLSDKVKVTYLIKNMVPNKEQLKSAIKNKNLFSILKEGLYSTKLLILKNTLNKKAIKKCSSDIIISTRDFHNDLIGKYANTSCIKISTEHNHHNNDKKYIQNLLNSLKGFDYFLPISKELTNDYAKKLAGTKTKVLHIPFCIDTPACEVQPTFEKPVYISVGRLSPEKGTLDLIHIFNNIVKKQPNAILHLVGDGPLMEDVKKLVSSYQLENKVIIHGFLNKNKIDELYCSSSIYLMTSYTESFGFVLLEAMACGLPCIAFDSAQGANEIIERGINGYLIPERDKDLFVQRVVSLYENKEKLKEMSTYAKNALSIYSYENTKNKWLDFMNRINKK